MCPWELQHWPVQCPRAGHLGGMESDIIYRSFVIDFKGIRVKILINSVSSPCQSKVGLFIMKHNLPEQVKMQGYMPNLNNQREKVHKTKLENKEKIKPQGILPHIQFQNPEASSFLHHLSRN